MASRFKTESCVVWAVTDVSRHKGSTKIHKCYIKHRSRCDVTHLRGNGSGQCVRGLLAVGGGSLRLLSDWLLCTCLSTLLFRSSSVVMVFHCQGKRRATIRPDKQRLGKWVEIQPRDLIFKTGCLEKHSWVGGFFRSNQLHNHPLLF